MKKPLVIIAGPTASGKSSLAVALSKRVNGEVISADSMQVYKNLDIGSAKISLADMQGVCHHLIDCLDFDEDFNVVRFKELATDALLDIYSRNKLPIVAGGTGFYIQALLYDIDFAIEDNSAIRSELENRAKSEGANALYNELSQIDIDAAKKFHPNNIKRTIRALEYYYLNNKKFSEHNEAQRQNESPYNFAFFVLTDERSVLYDRIDKRVDLMLENGLYDEAKALYDKGLRPGMTAAEGIGYKQLIAHFSGDISYEEAVNKIKLDSRHYAKRQLTWFKREKDAIFLNRQSFDCDEEKILDYIMTIIEDKGICYAK